MIDRIRHDIQQRIEQLVSEADKLRQALRALGSGDGRASARTGRRPTAPSGAPRKSPAARTRSASAPATGERATSTTKRTRPSAAGRPAAKKPATRRPRTQAAAAGATAEAAPAGATSQAAPAQAAGAPSQAAPAQAAGATSQAAPAQAAGATSQAAPAQAAGATSATSRTRTPSGATRRAVLAALASANGEPMTAGQVASATGLGRPSVSTTLSKLAKTGEVNKATRGYSLATADGSTSGAGSSADSSSTPDSG